MNKTEKDEIAKLWTFYHLIQKLVTGRFTDDEAFMLNTAIITADGKRLQLTKKELDQIRDLAKPLKPAILKKLRAMDAAIVALGNRDEGKIEYGEGADYNLGWESYMTEMMRTLEQIAKFNADHKAKQEASKKTKVVEYMSNEDAIKALTNAGITGAIRDSLRKTEALRESLSQIEAEYKAEWEKIYNLIPQIDRVLQEAQGNTKPAKPKAPRKRPVRQRPRG